jgi:anti-sigma B factor antagonist
VSCPSSIQVGLINDTVWIRVEGKGSFQNSTPLKDFAREMLGRGHRAFVVDLKECPFMDSTFMGTLASIALKSRADGAGGLHIVNLNERTQDLLCNLGLDQLMQLDPPQAGLVLNGQAVPLEINCRPDKAADALTMLEAHEAVVAANPENEVKFRDVIDFLRQNVEADR